MKFTSRILMIMWGLQSRPVFKTALDCPIWAEDSNSFPSIFFFFFTCGPTCCGRLFLSVGHSTRPDVLDLLTLTWCLGSLRALASGPIRNLTKGKWVQIICSSLAVLEAWNSATGFSKTKPSAAGPTNQWTEPCNVNISPSNCFSSSSTSAKVCSAWIDYAKITWLRTYSFVSFP